MSRRIPRHRSENPVVEVCLASNTNHIFSILVPRDKNWNTFISTIRQKFNLHPKTSIRLGRQLFNESTDTDDFATVPIDFNREPDMSVTTHGTIFCITVGQPVEDPAPEIEPEVIHATPTKFDLFGRLPISKSKKQRRLPPPQRRLRKVWKQIRHATATCCHLDEDWTEWSVSLTKHDGEQEEMCRFRLARVVWPASVQMYGVGNTFEYGVEAMMSWRWTIILCHGGRFSCGIFVGGEAVKHRTCVRHVARTKNGSRSVNTRKRSTAAKHAREKNEGKLHLDIVGTLQEWQHEICASHLILVHAPGPVNEVSVFGTAKEQSDLYGGRGCTEEVIERRLEACWNNRHANGFRLNRNDGRVKRVGVTTYRPKFEELQRVHRLYATCVAVL